MIKLYVVPNLHASNATLRCVRVLVKEMRDVIVFIVIATPMIWIHIFAPPCVAFAVKGRAKKHPDIGPAPIVNRGRRCVSACAEIGTRNANTAALSQVLKIMRWSFRDCSAEDQEQNRTSPP